MDDETHVDSVTVYSDYVCPFCYLGRASLDRYRDGREEPLAIEWHPFDLRADRRGPDGEIDGEAADGRDDAYYERARQNVERLQAEYGVEMAHSIAHDVDSRSAQLASVHVQMERPDDWLAFDRAIFDALWQDGRDIGDTDVLADLATDVGLDPEEIRVALDDDMVQRRLDDQFEAARLRGITGVPTFVAGEEAIQGAVPPSRFQAAFEDG